MITITEVEVRKLLHQTLHSVKKGRIVYCVASRKNIIGLLFFRIKRLSFILQGIS